MHKRFMRVTLSLALCLSMLFSLSVGAAPVVNGELSSLTIEYIVEREPVPGADVDLWRVGDFSGDTYALFPPYDAYGVSVDKIDASEWTSAASLLSSYLARDGISPDDSGKTGADGLLTFTDLLPGLYLVVGHTVTTGDYTYDFTPFLILLPSWSEGAVGAGEPQYDVTIRPKAKRVKVPDTPPTPVERKVLKIWRDDGNERLRPAGISVQLLRDGKVWDTVVLNENNGWRHAWRDLSPDFTWTVVEENVPAGYEVTVSREGITFVLTNTRTPEETKPPETEPPETKPPETEPPETEPPETEPPETEPPETEPPETTPRDTPPTDTPDQPTLPQTGQLWWPVFVLTALGLLCLILGVIRRRRSPDPEQIERNG